MKTKINEIIELIHNRELEQADFKLNALLNRRSRSSELMYIKAMIEKEKNNLSNSEDYLKKAIQYDHRNFHYRSELISIYVAQNKNEIALREAEKLLSRYPNNTEILLSLASAHAKLRNMDIAENILKKIISIEPKNHIALYLLSISYYDQKKYAESVNTAINALGINPNLSYMRTIIADHYSSREDKFLIAIQLLNEEIKLFPNSDCAYRILGSTYSRLGEINKCLAYTKKQIELNPACNVSRNNYLLFAHYSPDLNSEDILEAAHDYYKFCIKKYDNKQEYSHENRIKNKILKIGFVSGDFRNHALFFWLRQFFKELVNFEVETYYYCNNKEDNFSQEIREIATNWQNIQKLSDEEVAETIYKENIDILFDLSGHTAKNRLEIFMHKPAPIQITWLGQSGPLGIPQIDYMLTDAYLVREGEEKDYTEKIIRMPNSFAPYGTFDNEIKIKEAPYKKNGYVTFGCFNNFLKVNPKVMQSWIEILKKVPQSHLYLKSHLFIDATVINNFKKYYTDNQINPERIRMEAFSTDRNEYLELYNEIDIALDPFPLGGGTTTHDLLFMGTPLIATCGNRMSHRISASLLSQLECDELIANSKEEYIQLAIDLANNPEKISEYKSDLRQRYLRSIIADNKTFAKNFIALCKELVLKAE